MNSIITLPAKQPPAVGRFLTVVLADCEWPVVEVIATHDDGTWDGHLPQVLRCTDRHGFAPGSLVKFVHSPAEQRFGWSPAGLAQWPYEVADEDKPGYVPPEAIEPGDPTWPH